MKPHICKYCKSRGIYSPMKLFLENHKWACPKCSNVEKATMHEEAKYKHGI